jgi:hypothetical protein
VWRGAIRVNNTESQVESLSQEMADYAAVEDVRHNQKVERHNQRLAWGGLIFVILAIALPLVYSEMGIGATLFAGAVVLGAMGSCYGLWTLLRRRDGHSIGTRLNHG